MKRRAFLRRVPAAFAGLAFFAARGQAGPTPNPLTMHHTSNMNVLFINIDDVTAGALGCYGNSVVKTPHLDCFATAAIRFARCYCQVPACYPSCSSLLTGLRPKTSGIYDDSAQIEQCLPAGTRSLPELLNQYGIHTVNIGNLFHHPGAATQRLNAFDRLEFSPLPEGYAGESKGLAPELRDTLTSHEPNVQKATLAAHVLSQLARRERQFFMSLGFTRPQAPLRCPDSYVDLYDPGDIPLPEAHPATDETVRKATRDYYGCVSFIDAQIGIVLEALEREGLGNDTIVIILSDRGFRLGEHSLWSERALFDQSTHVPLLIRVPGLTTMGTPCDEIVELVDLLPTICELLVIPPPDRLEGASLAPLLADPRQPWKLAAFTACSMAGRVGHSVRTKRWRYIDWQSRDTSLREFELYDLDTDPWEQRNLARDAGCRNQRTILANLLQRGWRVAHQRHVPGPATPPGRPSYRAGHILW